MIEDSSELDLLERVIALKLIDVAGLAPSEDSFVLGSDIDSGLAEQRCPTWLIRGVPTFSGFHFPCLPCVSSGTRSPGERVLLRMSEKSDSYR